MSSSPEELHIIEIHKRLIGEPFCVQRLGLAAFNAGIFERFMEGVDDGLDPKPLYTGLVSELRRQGVDDPEGILELFGVENPDD